MTLAIFVHFSDKLLNFCQKPHKHTLLKKKQGQKLVFLVHTYFFLIKKIF